jgi:tRNA pseudouridine55 synthase
MHGVINFLKPPGMTSHDAVAFVRRIAGTKRVGHTGTLDPAAAGVLPICIGQATRLVEYLQEGTKEYIAEVTFGQETDTLDAMGEVVSTGDASHVRGKRCVTY